MKDKKKTRSFSKFICLLALIVLGTFLYLLKMTDVLPSKYFLVISITLGVLWLLYLFICLNRRIKRSILVFFNIAAILIILIEGFGCYENSFLEL